MKLDSYLSPCTKIHSGWTKYLHVKLEILNPLAENTKVILQDTGMCENFMNRTPAAQELAPSVGRWDRTKQSICTTEKTVGTAASPQDGREPLPLS